MDLTDLDTLSAMSLNGFSYHFHGFASQSDQIDEKLIPSLELTCLAVYNGEIYQGEERWCGEVILSVYVGCHKSPKKFLFLEKIEIDPSFRSKGVGSLILNELFSYAKRKGCSLAFGDLYDDDDLDGSNKKQRERFYIKNKCSISYDKSRFWKAL